MDVISGWLDFYRRKVVAIEKILSDGFVAYKATRPDCDCKSEIEFLNFWKMELEWAKKKAIAFN